MSKYQLKIKLLSDMCVSDGGVYNSSVDVDICYDEYGFPYIPAKRLRGCLRECAIELQDWNMDIPWLKMFGQGGSSTKRAAIRIEDARLENFVEMKKLARENEGRTVYHPQNILNHFTYIRTQTSINYETGVAETASLRTMRVADKDLTFIAEVDMDPVYKEHMENCCKVFHNIGVSRTRGLGEIAVSLVEPDIGQPETSHALDSDTGQPETGHASDSDIAQSKMRHVPYAEGAEILQYQLLLEEPVICKSVNGGEARTLDYIEGSKMLGLLLENADSREEFLNVMNSAELFCSNAYIAQNHIRYTEVPAYIYSVKNDSSHYVNKLYPDPVCVKEEELQLNVMKHCYVYIDKKQKLNKKSVKIEERYHHRRPEDKAIGRAAEEEDGNSQFYQMSSIESGQVFQGFFAGSAEQIKAVYDILSKQDVYYIGYSRTSEYGKVRLQVTDMKKKTQPAAIKAKRFLVKLEAPAIVYNQNAFYSTDAQDLIDEVNAVLGISEDMLDKQSGVKRYVRYTTLGGYNTTWNYPKPIIVAFEKGTVLFYTLKEETELAVPPVFLVGERVSEGYGEASVQLLDDTENHEGLLEICDETKAKTEEYVDAGKSSFTYALCKDLFRDYVLLTAAQDAKRGKFGLETRPTVSNMLLMCQENQEFKKVEDACYERYEKNTDGKKEKLGYAKKILDAAKENTKEILKGFCQTYKIKNFEFDDNMQKMLYLDSFLKQLKYNFRQAEKRKGGGENE